MLWSLRYCSKFAVEKLPQISQILTDVRVRILPTESTDFTEFFPARKFCVFCEICGSFLSKKVLCKSVKSVGEYLSKKVLCVL